MPSGMKTEVQTRHHRSRQGRRTGLQLLGATLAVLLLTAVSVPALAEISIVSHHLRDRAVVTDSLLMRKIMIFAFRTSRPFAAVQKSAAAGVLEHAGAVVSVDTTWLFDQPAGNLGFCLPYDIPDGIYTLKIRILSPAGQVLDSYSGDFDRKDLKLFYNREINFWDFTTPYAHLECAGYGELTYRFESASAFKPR
ncbi:MAG: hypothetical protein V1794_18575, partial [Candidatus Glassbacteria bacterium]